MDREKGPSFIEDLAFYRITPPPPFFPHFGPGALKSVPDEGFPVGLGAAAPLLTIPGQKKGTKSLKDSLTFFPFFSPSKFTFYEGKKLISAVWVQFQNECF